MEHYQIYRFLVDIEKIEAFLIKVAAAEAYLAEHGLRKAQIIEGYKDAVLGLKSFQENYVSFRRYTLLLDAELSRQVVSLDVDAKLPDQMSLLLLNLTMHEVDTPRVPAVWSFAQKFMATLPYLGFIEKPRLFQSEDISLHKAIVSLGRLKGIVKLAQDMAYARQESAGDVLRSSNLNNNKVVSFIEQVELQIADVVGLPLKQRENILSLLREAKQEAVSPRPSWTKIVGSLVIVAAAITSAVADAPAASKTLKDTIEYIMGSGLERPVQPLFPPQQKSLDNDERIT